jgi:hypothetical protein
MKILITVRVTNQGINGIILKSFLSQFLWQFSSSCEKRILHDEISFSDDEMRINISKNDDLFLLSLLQMFVNLLLFCWWYYNLVEGISIVILVFLLGIWKTAAAKLNREHEEYHRESWCLLRKTTEHLFYLTLRIWEGCHLAIPLKNERNSMLVSISNTQK